MHKIPLSRLNRNVGGRQQKTGFVGCQAGAAVCGKACTSWFVRGIHRGNRPEHGQNQGSSAGG
jgi:hypothetical protein